MNRWPLTISFIVFYAGLAIGLTIGHRWHQTTSTHWHPISTAEWLQGVQTPSQPRQSLWVIDPTQQRED